MNKHLSGVPTTQILAHNLFDFAGSTDLAGGDFDGDGDDEVATLRGGRIQVFEPVSGSPFWNKTADYAVPAHVTHLTAADWDGDNRDELITLSGMWLSAYALGSSMILETVNMIPLPMVDDLAGVDYDGDGFDEVMVVSHLGYGYVGELQIRSGEPMVWVATEHWMIPAAQNYLRIAAWTTTATANMRWPLSNSDPQCTVPGKIFKTRES